MIFVLGTPASGKSKLAEDIIDELHAKNGSNPDKIYIATMEPYGEEGKMRVAKHRREREGKGYITIEQYTNIDTVTKQLSNPAEAICLLECVTNLVGNEMYAKSNEGKSKEELAKYIVGQIVSLDSAVSGLVVVSNYFSSDDYDDEETVSYVNLVSDVNDSLRKYAQEVYCKTEEKWERHAKN